MKTDSESPFGVVEHFQHEFRMGSQANRKDSLTGPVQWVRMPEITDMSVAIIVRLDWIRGFEKSGRGEFELFETDYKRVPKSPRSPLNIPRCSSVGDFFEPAP